ncbi:MAG: Gfo/Idh/MocA family oxidoreductase [Anaerolineae bacterium]|nr:Gfo/Idh/MocA family oxidoreductase [Anaerolineae bacterium]
MPLRVGIMGAGQVAQRHAEAYAQLNDVIVTAIADVDAKRAEALAKPSGARVYPNWEAMLDADLDAVSICLPHHLHRGSATAAAQRGWHILLEKPIANTLADADAILQATGQAEVRLMISFVHRFREEWQTAKGIIARGELGTPTMALDNLLSQGGRYVPAWVWRRAEAGGGVLMYGGIHAVDRVRWLLGSEVTQVYAQARTYSQTTDCEDGLTAILTFANGATATLFENSPGYRVTPRHWATEVFGSEGMLRVWTREFVEFSSETRAYRVTIERDDNFLRQAAEFVAAIREDRDPSVTGEDGRAALAVALAIYQSAEGRRVVQLSANA